MVELQIDQRFGNIGLNIQPMQYNIDVQPAELDIKQVPAQIFLEQPAAILDIDYTLMRDALGYRSIESQTRYLSNEAKADYMAGLDRRVAEGHKLGQIEKKISIAQIASENFEPKEKQVTIEYLPSPKIQVTQQPVQWKAEPGGVQGTYHAGDVNIDVVSMPKVSTYLEQQPYIDIKGVGWAIDIKS